MANIIIGAIFVNNQGSKFIIEKIDGRMKVHIRYLDQHSYRAVVTTQNIKLGSVKNPYHPNVLNVGYMGVGDYKSAINGKRTAEYESWKGMLQRAYCPRLHARNPAYIGCSVDPIWHNFQNFAEWLNSQKNWGKDGFDLDKDILFDGNKIYGPQFCEILPRRINSIRMRAPTTNGLPQGVTKSPSGAFRASCRNGQKDIKLGTHKCKWAAFEAYRDFKENIIKQAAEEFKDEISKRVYLSLKAYRVKP